MNILEAYRKAAGLRTNGAERVGDAGGGFATPASPTILPAGAQDPRTRAFTEVVMDPAYVSNPNDPFDGLKRELAKRPPDEDLDRIALFAPPAPGFTAYTWPGGVAAKPDGTDATWADIEALGQGAVDSSLGWWRQAVALGPLPEDDEYDEEETREPSYNWPCSGCNRTRKIYFWGYGKDGKLFKQMQLQKKDSFDNWRIFNKWGQNLTYVFHPDKGTWEAGFDFGDWFVQNRMKVIAGIQVAFQAVVMALSFGTAAPGTVLSTMATTSAILASQNALQGALNGIASGNFDAALSSIYNMGAALANIPEIKDAVAKSKDLQDFLKSEPMQVMAKVTDGMKFPPKPEDVLKRAAQLADQLGGLSPDLLKTARSQVPDQLLPFFDMAWHKGSKAIIDRAKIPWYAQGVYDFGAVLGTVAENSLMARAAAVQMDPNAAYTYKQALAISKQMAEQGGSQLTVKQVLEGKAGIKLPRRLPKDGSRSPKPASEKTGLGTIVILVLLAVAVFFFFR